MDTKIKGIIDKFPPLSEYEDMIAFVLELRSTFNLQKVPFKLSVNDWHSGSLENYYKSVEELRKRERKTEKARIKKKYGTKRTGSWVKY